MWVIYEKFQSVPTKNREIFRISIENRFSEEKHTNKRIVQKIIGYSKEQIDKKIKW